MFLCIAYQNNSSMFAYPNVKLYLIERFSDWTLCLQLNIANKAFLETFGVFDTFSFGQKNKTQALLIKCIHWLIEALFDIKVIQVFCIFSQHWKPCKCWLGWIRMQSSHPDWRWCDSQTLQLVYNSVLGWTCTSKGNWHLRCWSLPPVYKCECVHNLYWMPVSVIPHQSPQLSLCPAALPSGSGSQEVAQGWLW